VGGRDLLMARRRLTRTADGSLRGALTGLAALAHQRRVTTRPMSASLRLLPLRPWAAPPPPPPAVEVRSAGNSSYYEQWREARVPGRADDLFSLLSAREDCPPRALLRSTRWLEWHEDDELATTQGWRFTELEGYRLLDVGASGHHTTQTCGMAAGRLAFVSQGHGRISLVLVCAHGTSILVREMCSAQ